MKNKQTMGRDEERVGNTPHADTGGRAGEQVSNRAGGSVDEADADEFEEDGDDLEDQEDEEENEGGI